MLGAAYAYENPSYTDYRNRTGYFGSSDTQAAQRLNQSLGGQADAQAASQQAQQRSQANAMGMANTARGGRGNYLARSAMLQAPQAQQMGTQAQYQQQQANYQNAANAQNFEAQRRAGVEGQAVGEYATGNEDALRQQRETNNTINAIAGVGQVFSGAAMSDERVKRVLGKREGMGSPSVIIMLGGGGLHDDDDDEDEDEDEDSAGNEAVDAMRAVEPANFEYKPEFQSAPGAGDGEYTGIMAQDLEKTPAGAGTVMRGADGLRRVDGAKLASLNTAALSKVVKDVDKLKGAKRG
jgi:hypothetical protein